MIDRDNIVVSLKGSSTEDRLLMLTYLAVLNEKMWNMHMYSHLIVDYNSDSNNTFEFHDEKWSTVHKSSREATLTLQEFIQMLQNTINGK